MPPGALSRLLQFPKTEEEDDPQAQTPPIKKVMPQGMPAGAAPRSGGIDDDIQQQMEILKGLQANRPQANIGGPPQMPNLPQRPQQGLADLIPQALAGAGDVFSTMGGNYRDYLGRVQGMQKDKRDQAYGDQIAQAHNMFQNEREQYTDKLMRYSMELRDHQQRASDAHSLLQTLVEQKYLQGQKTPQDMQYQQKLEGYRAQFDKFDMIKEAEEHGRQLKATRPEDSAIIDQALQGKKGEIQGRPQSTLEFLMDKKPGRGFFESTEGGSAWDLINTARAAGAKNSYNTPSLPTEKTLPFIQRSSSVPGFPAGSSGAKRMADEQKRKSLAQQLTEEEQRRKNLSPSAKEIEDFYEKQKQQKD